MSGCNTIAALALYFRVHFAITHHLLVNSSRIHTMSFSTQFAENSSPFDKDLATLSNYTDVRTTHIDLDWTIDWENQVISGHANLKLTATTDTHEIVLDSSYLDVKDVHVDGGKAKWAHGERNGAMGEGLTISVQNGIKAGQVCWDPLPRSLQWMCTDEHSKSASRLCTRLPKTALLLDGSTPCEPYLVPSYGSS